LQVGAEDRSVPPWQQRRMTRVLDEAGIDVRYDEVPQKEHW
jgi:dipeptidyl aminopeptidase/acylaminoacyl peptidase